MKCVICRYGEAFPGRTTITLERDSVILIIKGVPAQVCASCGEAYTDEEVTRRLLETAEQAVRAGVQVEIREYATA